ncbi:MAG: homoserine dehydrogenase [Lentisphaeria bacterium]|nr:homoserine dehydrogenase [Lentisphaeria bacterium]MBQ7404624.1 homoserine dehydrogenase [Lentisphaeria bacterium]
MKELGVGIIGFGIVGAGVAQCLLENGDVIARRDGVKLVLKRVADLDITTDRGVKIPDGVLTTNAMEAIEECDIIVELVGGTTIAKTFILEALKRGKPVVTANKALLAKYGEEIFAEAEKTGTDVYYEASVGGGIPIIKSLREGFAGNRILRMYGILNGTCNYILTRMERTGEDFDAVLKDAQKLGYAEANPSLDIDGFDTAHKTAILASLAYGKWFGMDPVYVEGITNVSMNDIKCAASLGYKVKLLAIIKQDTDSGKLEIRVHPTLIPVNSMLASVNDVFNAVRVDGDYVGNTLFYGRGAGRQATASAVVGDIVDVALNLADGAKQRVPSYNQANLFTELVPMDDIETRCYLRFTVADKPGVLAKITNILASADISISSLIQNETKDEDFATLVMMTHKAKEADIKNAIAEIEKLDDVTSNIKMIRIEDI